MIAEAKNRYALPLRTLAAEMGLSAATLIRWRRRVSRGQAAVGRRGPRKVTPLNLSELTDRIQGLGHGRKRSRGSGALHRAYAGVVSRRELAMPWSARCERIPPGAVWPRPIMSAGCGRTWPGPWTIAEKDERAIDGTLHLHNLTDLHSRYRLPPLASHGLPCGEEVSGHLQYLFDRFDPPLFCKRDNGGNLNHVAVNQVLEEALVIPINSPPYRALLQWGDRTQPGRVQELPRSVELESRHGREPRIADPRPPPMT